MTDEKHEELTNAERKTFRLLYSGLVELQASVLYYVSEAPDNANRVRRAGNVVEALLSFRKKVLGDECPSGTVPCGDGQCRPPGGCGPTSLHIGDPRGGKDG